MHAEVKKPHLQTKLGEVCVSGHEYDRSKLYAHASAEVKECRLMQGPEKQIEGERQSQRGHLAERAFHGPAGSVTSTAGASFTLGVDRLVTA